jgi:hypothetical protein
MARFVEKSYLTVSEVEELPSREATHMPVILAQNRTGTLLVAGEYVKIKMLDSGYVIDSITQGGDYMVYPFLKNPIGTMGFGYVMLNPNLIKNIHHNFDIKFLKLESSK